MSARSKIFLIGFSMSVVAIIAVFVYISFATHDPHWLNRGGALVAACAAGAAFFEIMSEIDIERRRREDELESASQGGDEEFSSSLFDEKAWEIIQIEKEHRSSRLTSERLRIAAVVVVCALLGELLHGFGDLVLEGLFAL